MNDLCADIGYKSINHVGEELCGDHIDVVEEGENSTVIVLADGLGSGVKASILSTLTSKIISTMMAAGLPIEECVSTIAATLPVCSTRGVAYSTFTIIHLLNNQVADIIQYDNPHVIVIRDFEIYDYPKTEMNIGGLLQFLSPSAVSPHSGYLSASAFVLAVSGLFPFAFALGSGYSAPGSHLLSDASRLPRNYRSRSQLAQITM